MLPEIASTAGNWDINRDGFVTPLDALLLTDYFNSSGEGASVESSQAILADSIMAAPMIARIREIGGDELGDELSDEPVDVSLQEASPCANCSRFDHVELDCPVMAIQGQNMYRQGPSGGPTQQGRANFPGTYPNYYNTTIFNNSSQNNGFRTNNDQPYPPKYNGQQQRQSYPNQRQSSFIPPTQPQAYT